MTSKQTNTIVSTEGSTLKQWMVTLIVNISILSYGMQSGWMSPSISKLQAGDSPAGYSLSDMEINFVASSMTVAAILSTTFYSYFIDRFGRKMGITAIVLPQLIGWILKAFSAHPICLITSQVFVGIASGGIFVVGPIYTKELCEDHIRGVISTVGMLFMSLGVLIGYAMGAYFDYYTVVYSSILVPLLNLFLLYSVPESPPYLVKQKKIEETKVALASLFGLSKDHKKVQYALEELVAQDERVMNLPTVTFKAIFADKVNKRGFLIGLFMISVVDISGNFAVMSYASLILSRSGVTFYPDLQAISFPAVMLVGSWISTITITKFGRKPLLITFFILGAIPLAALGAHLQLIDLGYMPPQWIPVAGIIVSLFSYGAGILPVPYLVMSEILKFQIRAKAFGVYVTYGWALCFVQTFTFTPLSQAFGMHSVFYMYAVFNAISAICLAIFMPETRGKTLDEIESKFRGK